MLGAADFDFKADATFRLCATSISNRLRLQFTRHISTFRPTPRHQLSHHASIRVKRLMPIGRLSFSISCLSQLLSADMLQRIYFRRLLLLQPIRRHMSYIGY